MPVLILENFPLGQFQLVLAQQWSRNNWNSDQVPDDHRGPYKGFRKQHDGWGENDFDYSPVANMHYSEIGSSQRKPMRDKGWEVYHRKKAYESEDISKSVIGKEFPSQFLCNQQGQISVTPINLPERKTKAVDESLLKKPEPLTSPSEGLQHVPIIKIDAVLIDKIEGLNIKAWISDDRTEARPTREEKIKQLGIMNTKAVLSALGSVRRVVLKEKSNASGAFIPLHKGSVDVPIANGGYEPTAIGRVLALATQHPR